MNIKRRTLLTWVTPTVAAVVLPAHAQTSSEVVVPPEPLEPPVTPPEPPKEYKCTKKAVEDLQVKEKVCPKGIEVIADEATAFKQGNLNTACDKQKHREFCKFDGILEDNLECPGYSIRKNRTIDYLDNEVCAGVLPE